MTRATPTPAHTGSRTARRAATAAVLAGLAATAVCAAPASAATAPAAADVRVNLAGAFQSHDALAAIEQSAYLRKGSALGAAAERVTAQSRTALAAALAATPAQAAALRAAFTASDMAKLAYARGLDRYIGSAAMAAAGARAVVAARPGLVNAMAAALPGVPRTTLNTLVAQQDALDVAAIAALGARSPQTFLLVESAHLNTRVLARAAAVAIDRARNLPGSAVSPTAELRAGMVNIGIGHVVQTGLASDAGLTYGLHSAQYAGAATALMKNTNDWTAAVQKVSNAQTAAAFRAQWQRHINDYVTDVHGWIVSSVRVRAAAAADLNAFDRASAPLLQALSTIPAPALLPNLQVHTSGTLVVIAQQAQRSPAQFATAAMGTAHFAGVSDALAKGIARRLHLAP